MVPGVLGVTPQRVSLAPVGAEVGEENPWRDQKSPRTSPRATTRTCDRWGSSPSCERTLGFLSNFAVAFSYISVVDRHVHEPGRRIRRRRTGRLLGVAARHPRPDLRRAELRRAGQPLPGRGLDLPVVEAPVQPDARLVHRLDLLLGGGRDGHRRRGHRAARPRRRSTRRSSFARLARPSGVTTMCTFIGPRRPC